jgi:putative oxidoreductase
MLRALAKALGRRTEESYALLRIVAGAMFTFHGVQKVFGVLTPSPASVGSQLWIGGIIELVCGVAVAFGCFTRAAAFIASGTMAVAYIQFHWKLRGGTQLLPGVNKGELAALYSFLFLFVAARGAGAWSVDAARTRAN